MRKYLVLFAVCTYSIISNAQNVGIGVPNPQNKLHVGGGFRLDTLTGVGGTGLLWHNPNGVVYGLKFSGNTSDVLRGDGTFGSGGAGSVGWLLTGNSGTDPAIHFLGTTDDQPLVFKVNSIRNGYVGNSIFWGSNAGLANLGSGTIGIGRGALQNSLGHNNAGLVAIGDSALFHNIGTNPGFNAAGIQNTAVGARSLYSNLGGNSNTAIGALSLEFNTTGSENTAFGTASLRFNREGFSNTAIGRSALAFNNGNYNSAVGVSALLNNGTGTNNTSIGARSLISNNSGSDNTAVGYNSLSDNISGVSISAFGAYALENNIVNYTSAFGFKSLWKNFNGQFNSSFGSFSLQNNTSGSSNAAFGYLTLSDNTSGSSNSVFGTQAMFRNVSGFSNTAVGFSSLSNNLTGSANTAIGTLAGSGLPNNVSNVTVIGFTTGWNTTSSNQVNIGNFSVSWIGGQVQWSTYSDKRMKKDIKDDVPGLSFITRLRPVTYHVDVRLQEELANAGRKPDNSKAGNEAQKDWEGKYDVEKIKMTGFIAQDVEEAAKAINYAFSGVHKPKNGGLYSLNYSEFIMPLVKAVQEQQQIIEDQNKRIDKQQQQIDLLIREMQSLKKELGMQRN